VDVAALPLPGTEVTHPELLVASAVVLVATILFWVLTAPRRRDGREDAGRPRRGRRGPSVTVNVDPVRCARFGYCEHEAPEVFQLRREGRLTYQDRVPVDEIDPVIRAVEVCPARAISLGRLPRQ
jgi:sulfoxide reductase heme-binding subunit YedZ